MSTEAIDVTRPTHITLRSSLWHIPIMPKAMTSSASSTDVILPMQEPYMTQIVDGRKNYEFRKYRLKPSIKRVWFYRTAPHSSISHICEIAPAQTRNPGDTPLEETGLGNKEFNTRHQDWTSYDFAYKILSVYVIEKPLLLKDLRGKYGMKSAPRGFVYLPKAIFEQISWHKQKKIWQVG